MGLIVVDRTTDRIKGELNERNGLYSAVYKRGTGEVEMELDVSIYLNSEIEVKVGDSLILNDEVGKYREFIVQDIEEEDGKIGEVICVPSYLEDLGMSEPKMVDESKKGIPIIEEALKGTVWSKGEVVDLEYKYILDEENSVENSYVRALDVIKNVTQDKNIHLDYEVIINTEGTQKRLLNIYISKVVKNGKEVERGKDLTSLKRRESIADIVTAVKVIGKRKKKEKGKDGIDVEVVEDVIVVLTNDKVQEQIGKPKNYRWDILEVDSDDEEYLKRAGRNHLKDLARVQESFEVDVEDLGQHFSHEVVRYGDYVIIKDYNYEPALVVEGEVVGVEYDLINPWNRKYIVGELVAFRTELDSLRELLERNYVRIRKNYEEQSELKRRLVSISGEIDTEEEGTGFVYKNELNKGMIRQSGELFDAENYDETLKVTAVSSKRATSYIMGGVRGVKYGVLNITSDFHLKGNWVYTLRFKVGSSFRLNLYSAGRSVPLELYVNGEDKRDLIKAYWGSEVSILERVGRERDVWVDLQEGDDVEVVMVRNRETTGRLTDLEMYVSEPEVDVVFEGLILYNGTPYYGVNDLKGEYVIKGVQGENIEGNKVELPYNLGINSGFSSSADFATNGSLEVGNSGSTDDLYTLEIGKIIVEPITIADGRDFDTVIGKYPGMSIVDPVDVTHRMISVKEEDVESRIRGSDAEKNVGRPTVLINALIEEGYTYKDRVVLENYRQVLYVPVGTTRFDIRRVLPRRAYVETNTKMVFENIRIFRGVAPIGIKREGDNDLDEVVDRDLTTELGRLHARIDDKADNYHTHKISDVEDLQSKLDEINDELYKEPEPIVVDISSVTGLEGVLESKAEVIHSHTIEDIEGLVTRLIGIENRLSDLEM